MSESLLDTFLKKVQALDPYPVLYSRNSDGSIQTWKVEVCGNKYRVNSARKNSPNPIISEWTTCLGKNLGRANETSPEEQATKEARAALQKKLKSGGYWESEADIDKVRFIEPMLAYKLKDHRERVKYPVMLDRKYNGGRVVANREGLKSRKGEPYVTIPHIWDALQELFTKFPDMVLDGEGYNHDFRFKLNECMKLLRKTVNASPADIARAKQIIQYYVYDGYGFTVDGKEITKDTGCHERRQALQKLLKDFPYIVVVPFVIVYSEVELMKLYESYVADGYEGGIIRTIDAPYQNKRTKDLLKVKPMDDDEFEIVAVEEGDGNWSGKAKKITFRDKKGNVFGGSFKGTMEQAEEFLRKKNQWIGQTVTVHYFGFTGLGTPNFAQLDINNCLKSDR